MAGATARERVTARLAQLRGSYDGFDIRQTTISVTETEFDEITAGESTVLAEVIIENSDGQRLLIDGNHGWQPPSTTVTTGEAMAETICETVARQTGVESAIKDLDNAEIVSVGCEDSDETAYQLQLRFIATPIGGDPQPPAAWRDV